MNIAEIAENVMRLLGEDARELGRSTGFIQRQRKFDGATYAQMLICGVLSQPELRYTDLTQQAHVAGVQVSAQGIAARFTPAAAQFMAALLERAVNRVVEARMSTTIPVLEKFTGVYIRDSSVIGLPASLAELWPGVGGTAGQTAALKLQVRLNYSTGVLDGPMVQPGRTADRATPYELEDEPVGSLSLADLAYFNLNELQARDRRGQYVVVRYKQGITLYREDGSRVDLLAWLRTLPEERAEMWVLVGAKQRLRMRLLAEKVPPEVVAQRQHKLNEYARKKQVTPKPETYALAEWILILTNVPETVLTFDMVKTLLYLRWQVELLFKLWKSHFRVDEWRSMNPWRILCELYAKLIAAVIHQWISLLDWWHHPDRSWVKAAQAVQKFATPLALALRRREDLAETLHLITECIRATAHTNRRRHRPATFQTLLACWGKGALT
ncbi:MAG TPA: IS4 family transposase [Chloroflexi bacterium]|nr:IS4 family transposase [Chloroflexota bacterium]